MDNKNTVHLNNEILFKIKWKWNQEINRQMDGVGNNNSEWGTPDMKTNATCSFSSVFISF